MNKKNRTDFAVYLLQNHYSDSTIASYCRALKRLHLDYSIYDALPLYENINTCLEMYASSAPARSYAITNVAANRYFEMMVGQSMSAFFASLKSETPSDQVLDEFFHYSVNFKQMPKSAAHSECSYVRPFIEQLGYAGIEQYSTISAADVRDFVMNHFAGLKPSSIGRYVTSLRNFFRFLEYKGVKISASILTLPLAPANWKGSKMPVTLTVEEEERLRCHAFPDTELGARNRVILYLLLDLGLRCSEIPGIQLEDIHWNSGTVMIRNAKNGVPRELPLSRNLGSALEIYVLNYRPRCSGSFLLLNTKPCRGHSPVTIGTVRSVVRNVFKLCSVSGWWKGSHSIRRTAASNIYNCGAGIKLTADILGHESLDSTTHYVRVDFTALREICREWPGKGAAK